MLACAHTLFSTRTAARQPALEDLLTPIYHLITSKSALQPSHFLHSTAAAFGRAGRRLTLTTRDPALAAIMTRLDILRTHMVEGMGQSEDLCDVVIALSAVATLIQLCGRFRNRRGCFLGHGDVAVSGSGRASPNVCRAQCDCACCVNALGSVAGSEGGGEGWLVLARRGAVCAGESHGTVVRGSRGGSGCV